MSAKTEERRAQLWFRVAEADYVLPLRDVTEVAAAGTLYMIPLVDRRVAGILNNRGEPLPVVDGGAVLHGEVSESTRHALVFERRDLRLGVLVDYAVRIEQGLDHFAFEEPDPDLEPNDGCFEQRVTRDGKVIGIVDVDDFLSRAAHLLVGSSSMRRDELCPSEF